MLSSQGSTKLARYHDLTSGSGIVLIETDDPTRVIKHVNPEGGIAIPPSRLL